MTPFFSIITVCLNPGSKLAPTLQSVLEQDFADYELLLKDGGSTDTSLQTVKADGERVRLISKADRGIYDGMNQAVLEAKGEFVFFLNCGDVFADGHVLTRMAQTIRQMELIWKENGQKPGERHKIFYGDVLERLTGQRVASNPSLNAFGCYRNVPCHQACFYERELLLQHLFQLQYRVRADYEQFLWCFFKGEANPYYVELLITDYEGGGFSETKENLVQSKKEHREIVRKYMTCAQRIRFRAIMLLTLAPLRTWLSHNERTAGFYHHIKRVCYRK